MVITTVVAFSPTADIAYHMACILQVLGTGLSSLLLLL